ncbi:MAG: hypothetical protein HPY62_09605, partial [Bacteroidales bacterium]|nr:hypothetical protein [Bacteroidales bacterium]
NYTLQSQLPANATVRILAEEGRQYLVYINNWHPGKKQREEQIVSPSDFKLPINLPSGNYTCNWIEPTSGLRTKTIIKNHKGGEYIFYPSGITQDLALMIKKD